MLNRRAAARAAVLALSGLRTTGQTDGRTDGQTPDRCIMLTAINAINVIREADIHQCKPNRQVYYDTKIQKLKPYFVAF